MGPRVASRPAKPAFGSETVLTRTMSERCGLAAGAGLRPAGGEARTGKACERERRPAEGNRRFPSARLPREVGGDDVRAAVALERPVSAPTPTRLNDGRSRFARCSGLASHAATIARAVPSRPVPQARFSPAIELWTSNWSSRLPNAPCVKTLVVSISPLCATRRALQVVVVAQRRRGRDRRARGSSPAAPPRPDSTRRLSQRRARQAQRPRAARRGLCP